MQFLFKFLITYQFVIPNPNETKINTIILEEQYTKTSQYLPINFFYVLNSFLCPKNLTQKWFAIYLIKVCPS